MKITLSNRIIIILIALLFPASCAFALARDPFPNASRLQPISAFVRPDISGNINSAQTSSAQPAGETQASDISNSAQASANLDGASQPAQTPSAPRKISPWTLIVIAILVIAAVCALVWRATSEPAHDRIAQ